eukprot:TRINITY_DN12257_c0_g1_i1.p1 TRINITY_DN12257_c0_g1~~TRINITY_DN12257_c0_g1_i1.p1  ORF type:complete len:412 (-),score=88.70 TRINITY_DN12257_c0_g1_i1:390-1577(-)
MASLPVTIGAAISSHTAAPWTLQQSGGKSQERRAAPAQIFLRSQGSSAPQSPPWGRCAATPLALCGLGLATSLRSCQQSRWLGARRRSSLVSAVQRQASAAESRSVPCFRIEPVEGKGLGAVATRPVAAGELIAAQEPVLSIDTTSETWMADLAEAFDQLPQGSQEALFELHDTHAEGGVAEKTIEGIFETNSFSQSSESQVAGLCLTLARFNHSCMPNCEQSFDTKTGKFQIRASRDIVDGEELCPFYVDLRNSAEERSEDLKGAYGFQCSCPACQQRDAASDQRRQRLLELEMASREAAGDERLADSLDLIEETLQLLDEEGLHWQALRMRESYFAARLAMDLDDGHKSLAWLEKAQAACRLCHGPLHPDTKNLQRLGIGLKACLSLDERGEL